MSIQITQSTSGSALVSTFNEIIIIAFYLQTEIVKRLGAILGQIIPFLSQEHQQQVANAMDRAKQVTMTELNAVISVSIWKKNF